MPNENIEVKEKKKFKTFIFYSKLKMFGLIFGFSLIFFTFYLICYQISFTMFENFKNGFIEYQVFTERVTCVSENMFYTEKLFLFNESFT